MSKLPNALTNNHFLQLICNFALILLLLGFETGCTAENSDHTSHIKTQTNKNKTLETSELPKTNIRVITKSNFTPKLNSTSKIIRLPAKNRATVLNARQSAKKPIKPDRFIRPIVISAGRLVSGKTSIILNKIITTKAGQTCKTATQVWPCGNFAKAALQRFIRMRSITCEGKYKTPELYKGFCKIGNTDISHWLVSQGWAKADGASLRTLMQQAMDKKIGIWRQ